MLFRSRPEGRAAAKEELYDLRADPGEKDDRAAAEPDRLARMRASVQAHLSARWPGVHVRCEGPANLEIEADGLKRVDVLVGDPKDQLKLDGSFTAGLGAGAHELVLQTLAPTRLTLGGDARWPSESVETDALPKTPSAATPGACTLWSVTPAPPATSIDAETTEALEQLGYVGG